MENERVLRTEFLRNEEWVRVPKGPKLSRITSYHVMVAGGKVMLILVTVQRQGNSFSKTDVTGNGRGSRLDYAAAEGRSA